MRQNINIIIIGADTVNTLGLIRSVGIEGARPNVIVSTRYSKAWISRSKYIRSITIARSESDILQAIHSYKKAGCDNYLIPSSDPASIILDKHYQELSKEFLLPNCGEKTGGVIENLRTERMLQTARAAGLETPKQYDTETLKAMITAGEDLEGSDYPLFVKCLKAETNGKSFHIIHNRAELVDIFKNADTKEILIQEFIDIEEELGIQGVAFGAEKEAYVPAVIHKIRTSSIAKGSTVYARLSENPDIQKIVRRYINATGYDGIFDVELMRSKNKLYFIECNFRNGAYGFAYTKAGFNLPMIWIDRQSPAKSAPVKDSFTLMNEYSDFLQMRHGSCKPWTWVRQFLCADVLLTVNGKDMRPAIDRIAIKQKLHSKNDDI